MNTICLMGRLTTEPELKTTQTGVSVISFTLAVDRAYKAKDEERQTDFINCVAWRGTAEFISKHFHKGQRLALTGSLQSRKYTDKDGNNRTAFEVVADQAFFAESKQDNSNGGNPPVSAGAPTINREQPVQYPQTTFPAQTGGFSTATAQDFEEILTDEDLPF